MADPKFKKQLVTVPEKLAKEISTNIVVPASSIINKIGPAKFIKNIQKGNKPSPPGSVSATQLLNNKKNITDLQRYCTREKSSFLILKTMYSC
jgi:hypothetical protein